MIIAFDVDGTLISHSDKPRWEIIEILKTLATKTIGHRIVVWSGGGKDYADLWVRRLFLQDYVDEVRAKPIGLPMNLNDFMPDLAFDDEDVQLAVVNIKV